MDSSSPYAEALSRFTKTTHRIAVMGAETVYHEYATPHSTTTVILVHGFRGDHHGLEPVLAQLPELRFLVPDLPGFGESEPLTGQRHDLTAFRDWLSDFAGKTAAHEPWWLLGHSFGSIICAAAVADGLEPERLILINPVSAPALEGPRGVMTRLATFYYWMGARLPRGMGEGLLRNPAIVRVMSNVMTKTRDADLKRWIHSQHHEYFSLFHTRQALLESFSASVSHTVTDFAEGIGMPTLLIAAEKDDITPVSAQRELAELLPDATLQVIPGVGHLVHYEKPYAAADIIRAWAGGADGPQRG